MASRLSAIIEQRAGLQLRISRSFYPVLKALRLAGWLTKGARLQLLMLLQLRQRLSQW